MYFVINYYFKTVRVFITLTNVMKYLQTIKHFLEKLLLFIKQVNMGKTGIKTHKKGNIRDN